MAEETHPKTSVGLTGPAAETQPKLEGKTSVELTGPTAETQPKWEGNVSFELTGTTAEQIWPLFENFCDHHKWFPNTDICQCVEGVPGQPGVIRYCASTVAPSSNGSGEPEVRWVKEKLLMIDPIKRCFSYEVLENNMGIKSYVATIEVLAINCGDKVGCKLEWSFIGDPVEGWKYEDWYGFLNYCLQFMAKKMEQHVLQSTG